MNLNPPDLPAHSYVLLETLPHKDIMPFVKKWILKPTLSSLVYFGSTLISFGAMLYFVWELSSIKETDLPLVLKYVGNGLFASFVLIPLHEFIHVLAYKFVGARNTSYDVNWKKFYFLAIADKFIASRSEFRIVVLAPFVVISILLVVSAFFGDLEWTIISLSCLASHSSLCVGDFALLSFFESNSDKEVVTYDDKGEGMSYFYSR